MTAAVVEPLTGAERGQAARKAVRRRHHAEWAPAPGRRDPVEILDAQSTVRVAELVPIRYGRMLASAFSFYRGAAAVMAADLASTPNSGITVQLCGDAHVSNFGLYMAPDRRLVFGLNDFDETLMGPWEWDVKRLAASLEIAGRDRSFGSQDRRDAVLDAARAYREAMRGFAAQGSLAVWYARLDVDRFLDEAKGGDRDDLRMAQRMAAKARTKGNERALVKLTERVDGELRFRSEPPLLTRAVDLVDDDHRAALDDLDTLVDAYRASLAPHVAHLVSTYRQVDIARKVVGVGSVGTRAWIVLLEGQQGSDSLVLQAKQAEASVLEPHLGASPFDNHGERVVQGQHFMQAASDILLGWQCVRGIDGQQRDFYLRQLWDGKGSADIDTMLPGRLRAHGRLCGWTLARAHARSGDRVAIAAYLGSGDVFDRAMAAFAETYADQNERDFRALGQAVEDGRLEAHLDV